MREKLKYLLLLLPIILIIVLAIIFVPRLLKRTKVEPQDITLSYWGLFEPREVLNPLIDEYIKLFEEQNPGSTLKINYEQRFYDSLAQYRETVLARLKNGDGPDIMRLHATWVPQFAGELVPIPPEVMTVEQYTNIFYRVAAIKSNVG